MTNSHEPDLLFRLLLTTRRWRQFLDQKILSSGLTDATWRPLIHLLLLGNGINQKILAESVGISGPSLVRLLDSLVTKGLVERHEDESDRRARKLYLTTAGEQLARQVHQAIQDLNRQVLGDMNASEEQAIIALLQKLENNMNRYDEKTL